MGTAITMDIFREVTTTVVGVILIAAMLFLIYSSRGEEAQAWLVIGLVAQHFFNRSQSAANFRQFQQSQPTVTASPGPPATVTVEPPEAGRAAPNG